MDHVIRIINVQNASIAQGDWAQASEHVKRSDVLPDWSARLCTGTVETVAVWPHSLRDEGLISIDKLAGSVRIRSKL